MLKLKYLKNFLIDWEMHFVFEVTKESWVSACFRLVNQMAVTNQVAMQPNATKNLFMLSNAGLFCP
jgi:hypothetical protein